jgi:hypothetical protein
MAKSKVFSSVVLSKPDLKPAKPDKPPKKSRDRKNGGKAFAKPLSVAEVTVALIKYQGRITYAANELGINYITLRKFIDDNPEIEDVLTGMREHRIDRAEENLDRMLNQPKDYGHMVATLFTLKTIGKNRGYVEKVEHDVKNRGPMTVEIVRFSDPPPEEPPETT